MRAWFELCDPFCDGCVLDCLVRLCGRWTVAYGRVGSSAASHHAGSIVKSSPSHCAFAVVWPVYVRSSFNLSVRDPAEAVYGAGGRNPGADKCLADLVRSYGITQFARRPLDVTQNGQRFRIATSPPSPTTPTVGVSLLDPVLCVLKRWLLLLCSSLACVTLSVCVLLSGWSGHCRDVVRKLEPSDVHGKRV